MSIRVGALLLSCVTALPGQDHQGAFLCAAPAVGNPPAQGGLFLVDPVAGTTAGLGATGALANSFSVACDAFVDDVVWVGTAQASTQVAPAIHRVQASGGRILGTTGLTIGLTAADGTVWQLRSVGDDLVFLTDTRLALVAKSGGTPKTLLPLGGAAGRATDFATNGRDVYLLMRAASTTQSDHVDWMRIDTAAGGPLTIYTASRASVRIRSLVLEQGANPLLVESDSGSNLADLQLLDPVGTVLRSFRLPFPDGGLCAGIDDAAGVILAAGLRFDSGRQRVVTELIALRNWQVLTGPFGTTLEPYTRIDVRRHTPLHRHGHACLSLVSRQTLALRAQGLPAPGNSGYSLLLLGPRSVPGLLLVGMHFQLPSPLSLAAMGAGTCVLGVQPLVQVGVSLPVSGAFELKTPIPANTPNGIVDIQWLAAEPLANPAGLVSSQVGSIVVR